LFDRQPDGGGGLRRQGLRRRVALHRQTDVRSTFASDQPYASEEDRRPLSQGAEVFHAHGPKSLQRKASRGTPQWNPVEGARLDDDLVARDGALGAFRDRREFMSDEAEDRAADEKMNGSRPFRMFRFSVMLSKS